MIAIDGPVGSTIEAALPDGSTCLVERTGPGQSTISRYVDGVCVWGQVFSSYAADHPAQLRRVVEGMRETPAAYRRWYL